MLRSEDAILPDIFQEEEDQIEREERRKLEEQFEREQEIADLQWVLSNRRGRRFIWRLLSMTGLNDSSFVGEYPLHMAKNEGKREVGRNIITSLFTADERAYILLQTEALEEAKRKGS